MRILASLSAAGFAAAAFTASTLSAQAPHVAFEASQTRPVQVSDDGLRLFALDTASSRLTVWSLADPLRPVLIREIRAGLEPVSLAIESDDRVWVVDQLGDSVHVVSLGAGAVVATIPVGDEPGDVVLAGSPRKAFVSCTTDRQVVAIDTATHAVVGTVAVFADDPRSLCASADGSTVWVASFRSGNRTTLVPAQRAPAPPPPTNPALPAAPRQGLIVDSTDPAWSAVHGVQLPDLDVHAIDANALTVGATHAGVGTILFALAERPGHPGELWVANTEARNLVRFEPALRGHAIDSRLTRIDAAGAVTPFDLNSGIDYGTLPNPGAQAIALSQPTGITFSPDGARAFVAAFGNDRIGVVNPATGAVTARIDLAPGASPRAKRGTRAMAHHPTAAVLYALNRLSSSLTVVDTTNLAVVSELAFPHDPTAAPVADGRGFLYDAKLSGNGTQSCASCHIDGTTDNLAWDLGDPGGDMFPARDQFNRPTPLHPMKGPMLTQTLQGLRGHQPFHWRGDKPRLQDFNGAFDTLLGGAQLAAADMDDYADFLVEIVYPSNPNQELDGGLSPLAAQGRNFYVNQQFAPGVRCVDCHSLTRGSNGQIIDRITLGNRPDAVKVAQLRNAYKRTGMAPTPQGRTAGFGYVHDGEFATVADVLTLPVFGIVSQNAGLRAQLEAFVLSFDTGTAPTVGFAKTFAAGTVGNPQDPELLTLVADARRGACDLIAVGVLGGEPVGYLFDRFVQSFVPDRAGAANQSLAQLLTRVANGDGTLTIAGVPPASGPRLARDRDLDGRLDGDERPSPRGVASPAGSALRISAGSAAAVGNARFAFVVESAPAASAGVLLLGLPSAPTPLFGVDVLVAPLATISMASDARGTSAVPFPIPADPNLAGVGLSAQAVVVGAPHPPLGLAATAALDFSVDAR